MFYPEGVFPAMVTPFNADGSLNESVLRALTDFQIDAGVHGLFPVSSVGEAVYMETADKCRVMDIVMEQTRGRVPVVAGIAGRTAHESIALAKHAKKRGCAGVVLMPPYFFKPSPDMVTAFLEEVVDDVELPVIIYNIPLFTVPIPYEAIARLATRPHVVGMKDSSGSMVDLMHFIDCARQANSNMHFMVGREENLFACLQIGGKGCMTVTAAIMPEVMVAIYQHWIRGNIEKARQLQLAILPLIRETFSLPFPLAFKLVLELRGFDMGPNILPLSLEMKAKVDALRPRLQLLIRSLLEQAAV